MKITWLLKAQDYHTEVVFPRPFCEQLANGVPELYCQHRHNIGIKMTTPAIFSGSSVSLCFPLKGYFILSIGF